MSKAATIEHLSVGERVMLAYLVRPDRFNDRNAPTTFLDLPAKELRELKDGELLRVLHERLSQSLKRFANGASPRKFTLPQIWSLIVAAKVRKVSYRHLLRKLAKSDDAKAALGLRSLPDHSTLSHARKRPLELVGLDRRFKRIEL